MNDNRVVTRWFLSVQLYKHKLKHNFRALQRPSSVRSGLTSNHLKQTQTLTNAPIWIHRTLKRICCNDEILHIHATKLFKYFLPRQCPFPDCLHNNKKARHIDRLKFLSNFPKYNNKNICVLTIFCPKIDHFTQCIKSNYHTLKDYRRIGGIFFNLQYMLPNYLLSFVSF